MKRRGQRSKGLRRRRVNGRQRVEKGVGRKRK